MKSFNRLLDANVNRASEGIRVLEDIARFVYNTKELSKELRNKRHSLRKIFKHKDEKFLDARDLSSDVGVQVTKEDTLDKKENINSLVRANFKRVQEAMRNMEEILKIMNHYKESKELESLRYDFYTLEKAFQKNMRPHIPKGIYGITAENFSNGKSNYEVVEEMINSGVKIIQYREKNKTLREKLREAKKICELCKEKGVLFIVNDHVDIALMVDAHGVHVGQEDMPVEEIRKIIGANKIIGLSTHSREDAENALLKDIDYIGVGPIFPTTTKDRKAVGLDYLEFVENNINLPYIAIGGIKESNVKEIIKRGAKRIALVSEIVGAENIKEKIQRISAIMK